MTIVRRNTVGVKAGGVPIGGGAPVAVQSMTNTDTADIEATSAQILQLADAGSELVRITVNTEEAAAAVAPIVGRVRDAGCMAAIIGDFHYNGHRLLAEYPQCAMLLDKYRINPGNVGSGAGRDKNFARICQIAADNGKAIRIGVNAGSLNKDLVMLKMTENTRKSGGKSSEEVMNDCMIVSAIESTRLAIENGVGKDRIVISCKSSTPRHLIDIYRELSRQTDQPLHLGLTEAGIGIKGLVWSAVSMGVLLAEGIGDTIRVSLTPRVGGDRRDEVYAACEILQSLGQRSFMPSVTSCPGCGRTTSHFFQALAEETEAYVRTKMPEWKLKYVGVETLTLAVMGCVVNGPGESRAANIGISLPGSGEEPKCPVYVDGNHTMTLSGTPGQIGAAFREIIETYVQNRFPPRTAEATV
jgi:(E)-4-hydroxy-3-methylbut-2-enyl-diphosphate synthase